MVERSESRCFDAFPYAERLNRRLWHEGRQLPGWYPSLAHIFPMMACRVLPVSGLARPAVYSRVLGRPASGGQPAGWMGGYQARLLMDDTGWPVFRVDRLFVPFDGERPPGEVLLRLLEDAERIAGGMGAARFQVAVMETDGDRLPGFPAVGSLLGPLCDSRLGTLIDGLDFSPWGELGYYATDVDMAEGVAGRRYAWTVEDHALYLSLWADHCRRHREDLHFLAARLHPLDPHLQHKLDPGHRLDRVRFLGEPEQPAGFLSWYPDAYPQLLEGEASGPQVRLRLAELDAGAVTRARVLKCLAPLAGEEQEEALLAGGLRWAACAAAAAHPNLERIEAGPVPATHKAMIAALDGQGFRRFGRLRIVERKLSRFSD